MATSSEKLKKCISQLEKENPNSKVLQGLRRQLKGLKASMGKTAEKVYLSGNPVLPKTLPSAEVKASTD